MNNLTSRQRKLVYAGGILLLLVPIVYFGAPTSDVVVPGQKDVSGGLLARMRVQHDLGESTLGEIDPSSAAMNLVLLGLRGPAAGVLHLKALEYQEKKDWAKLKTTVDSIIKLQPHYVEIWKFQGWNLAFNVSREWDRVSDRFFWVKEGIKFLQLGTDRNQTASFLYYNVGDFMGRKFGNSDEKKFFRNFFKDDPDDERFGEGSADPEINPEQKDNYLVAKDWFDQANDKDRIFQIKGMTHVFARQGPARALMSYAAAIQKDGEFEKVKGAWDEAYKSWMDEYGQYTFLGLNDVKYKLNSSEEDLKQLSRENGVTLTVQRQIWDQNVKMTNFRFWSDFANCERSDLTVEAHRLIYEGKKAYARGEISVSEGEDGEEIASNAEKLFFEGIQKLEKVLLDSPNLANHNDYVEEGMLAVHYWQIIHEFNGKDLPAEYPLKAMCDANASSKPDIERRFALESRQGI